MVQGSYKVIYKQAGRSRGENYTGKTHSLEGAKKQVVLFNKFKKKYPKSAKGNSVKIVRVKQRRSSNPFGLRVPKINFGSFR